MQMVLSSTPWTSSKFLLFSKLKPRLFKVGGPFSLDTCPNCKVFSRPRQGRISGSQAPPVKQPVYVEHPQLGGRSWNGSLNVNDAKNIARLLGLGIMAAVVPLLGLYESARAAPANVNSNIRHALVLEKSAPVAMYGCNLRMAAISQSSFASMSNKLTYKIQEILSQRLAGKLLAVLLVTLPVVGVGGILYKLSSGLPLEQSIFKAYNAMTDVPGADICSEESMASSIVVNLIFFSGLFTFAVILGIVCDDISSMVEQVRAGNYQIVEEGHTIILNSNKQLGSVLRQMAIAKQERGLGTFKGPVVVMSSESKEELDRIVEQSLDGLNLNVRTRTGNTHDFLDLKKIAADKAASIIWLEPDDGDEAFVNAQRATAIASLKALGAGTTRSTHLVVQTPECTESLATGLPAVSLAVRSPPSTARSKLDIVEMYDAQNLERLLAQCSLQPGLGRVMTQIFQQSPDSCEIYLESFKELTGKTYTEARRMFDVAIPCGVLQSKGNKLRLNPSENYVLQDGDKLVLIAQSLDCIKLRQGDLPEISEWVKSVEHAAHGPKHTKILVLSFGDSTTQFLDAIGEFADETVEVNVVARSRPETMPTKLEPSQIKFEVGNPASYRRLAKTDLSTVSSVVLAGLEALDNETADAQVISTLMQIQDVASEQKLGIPIHVVAPITKPKSQEVANHLISEGHRVGMKCSTDLILPSELSSGVLTQVAAYPPLELVFKDLLDATGAEIYIRDPASYSLLGRGPVSWRDTAEVLRAQGETAIGYIRADESVRIGPGSSESHVFEKGDKLVVIAQD